MSDYKDPSCAKTCPACGGTFYRDKRNTWAYWYKARFCSRDCFGAFNGAEKIAARPPREEAFQKWFLQTEGCWNWLGAKDRDGYGAFSYAGRMYRAHRVALELDGRPVPKGMFACHHCDNPACVNPKHLYVGSPKDNVADMVERRRNQHGELHYAAKLSADDVRAIRADERDRREIAEEYGVTEWNISAIQSGKTWRSVA